MEYLKAVQEVDDEDECPSEDDASEYSNVSLSSPDAPLYESPEGPPKRRASEIQAELDAEAAASEEQEKQEKKEHAARLHGFVEARANSIRPSIIDQDALLAELDAAEKMTKQQSAANYLAHLQANADQEAERKNLQATQKKSQQRRASQLGLPKKPNLSSHHISRQVIVNSAELRKEAADLAVNFAALNVRQAAKNVKAHGEVQAKLKTRIDSSQRLVATLEKRMVNIEPLSYLLRQCINELEHARRNLWPIMNMAKARQNIRSQCPTGELDGDYLQRALIMEEKAVAAGRDAIQAETDRGEALLATLDKHIQEMHDHLNMKRVHAAHDKSILKVSLAKAKVTEDLMNMDRTKELDRSAWIRNVQDLLHVTHDLEEASHDFFVSSHELTKKTGRAAEEAAANTQSLFEKHNVEMNRLKRTVEKEMHESHQAVSSMESIVRDRLRRLTSIKKTMVIEEDKVKHAENYSAPTGKRGTLLFVMHTNQDKVNSRYDDLQEQYDCASRLLSELHATHNALEADRNMKSIAMKFTARCLAMTSTPDEEPMMAEFRKEMQWNLNRTKNALVQLKPDVLSALRKRIRAHASMADGGLDSLFSSIVDKKGPELSAEDVRGVLRTVLKVSQDVISDLQIAAFADMLDEDGSGGVDVQELREFVDKEPTQKVADFVVKPVESERAKRAARDASDKRPSLNTLPVLKPSQIATLKKRIRGAAWIAAADMGLPTGDGLALDSLFSKFDKDGGGELEDAEVRKAFRKGLKIPKTMISDLEMWTIIHMIDGDGSGAINVHELTEWVNSQ